MNKAIKPYYDFGVSLDIRNGGNILQEYMLVKNDNHQDELIPVSCNGKPPLKYKFS